jgi:hypothetical protein
MSLVTTANQQASAIAERLIIANDLSRLTTPERIQWYRARCNFLGLDWRLAPFDYIQLKGGLKLYLNANGADQLRKIHKISIEEMRWEFVDQLCVATVVGRTPDGRMDREIGAVLIKGLPPEEMANAPMKALTKAKRRLVISMGGLGVEDEIDTQPAEMTIPAAEMDAEAQGLMTGPPAQPVTPPQTTIMTHHHLTRDQQEGMFNEAVSRNVGGIMPVDTEQEPGTQTWRQVVTAIVDAYESLRIEQQRSGGEAPIALPDMGVLRDRRVSPGKVYRALLGLPIVSGLHVTADTVHGKPGTIMHALNEDEEQES